MLSLNALTEILEDGNAMYQKQSGALPADGWLAELIKEMRKQNV